MAHLHETIVANARQRVALNEVEGHTSESITTLFGLSSNGIFQLSDQSWHYNYDAIAPLLTLYNAQRVSFSGPQKDSPFFSRQQPNYSLFREAFSQSAVTSVIEKFQKKDDDLGVRLSYLFGGVVRYLQAIGQEERVIPAINYVAEMTALGDEKSAEAIASAMGMYIISTKATPEAVSKDEAFEERIMLMAESISQDPVSPIKTRDLGLSQVARLRAYAKGCDTNQPLPDLHELRERLNGFPTVGAEFHLPVEPAIKPESTLWKRLALLNMSQYQTGSSIQFSRNDRDVLEIRMNPSDWPTAIATWKYMKMLVPEIDMPRQNTAFFWITLNRPNENFSWQNDTPLVHKLISLGMISYLSTFANIPTQRRFGEENFGGAGLGQTVKLTPTGFVYDGSWSHNSPQDNGQLSIYTGFGDNFPQLAYWLSMALADPSILPDQIEGGAEGMDRQPARALVRFRTLDAAKQLSPTERRLFGMTLNNNINRNARLHNALEAGRKMMQLLAA